MRRRGALGGGTVLVCLGLGWSGCSSGGGTGRDAAAEADAAANGEPDSSPDVMVPMDAPAEEAWDVLQADAGDGSAADKGDGPSGDAPPSPPIAACGQFVPKSGGPANTLSLELGHGYALELVRLAGDRVVSRDASGRWVLWDSQTGKILLSGTQACTRLEGDICVERNKELDLKGAVFLVETDMAAEVRAASDGHLLATFTPPGRPHLAEGGAYVWSAATTGLHAWATDGQKRLTVAGDFGRAQAFGGAEALWVALGPAGDAVVEKIELGTGTRSSSPPFMGTFVRWFEDGSHLLARTGSVARVYSPAAVNQGLLDLTDDSSARLQGYADHFWLRDGPDNARLTVWKVGGGSTPLKLDGPPTADGPGHLLPIQLGDGPRRLGLVHLTAAGAYTTTEAVTFVECCTPGIEQRFAAEGLHWVAGALNGALFDNGGTAPLKVIACGASYSTAGSPDGTVAVALGGGQVLVTRLEAGSATPIANLPLLAGKLDLTADGHTLAVSGDELTLRSLPTGDVLSRWTLPDPAAGRLENLAVSRDGSYVAYQQHPGNPDRLVVERADHGEVVFTTSVPNGDYATLWLAPAGGRFALWATNSEGTRIFNQGTLVGAIPDPATSWLDDNRLLARHYETVKLPTSNFPTLQYVGARIYDRQGALASSPPLPEIKDAIPVDADRLYAPQENAIYRIDTGAKIWSAAFPHIASSRGTVAGRYVVYASGHEMIAEPY